jgi:hypothetical protein
MDSTRHRPSRIVAAGAGLLTSVLLLSGCGSLVDSLTGPSEAQRDKPGGEVTAASDADVFSIQVGDCANVPADGSEQVTSLPVVPCSDPHTDEVYAEKELAPGDFPGDDAILAQAEEFCLAEFEPFVGIAYDASALDIWPMFPAQEGWEIQDDRVIQCLITAGAEPTTGSLKGAGI